MRTPVRSGTKLQDNFRSSQKQPFLCQELPQHLLALRSLNSARSEFHPSPNPLQLAPIQKKSLTSSSA